MTQDVQEVLAERGARYGAFPEHARITQEIKRALKTPTLAAASVDVREALDMIAHKMGRIANGDPEYADSWVDIEGYARLVRERLEAEQTTTVNAPLFENLEVHVRDTTSDECPF